MGRGYWQGHGPGDGPAGLLQTPWGADLGAVCPEASLQPSDAAAAGEPVEAAVLGRGLLLRHTAVLSYHRSREFGRWRLGGAAVLQMEKSVRRTFTPISKERE